MGKYIDLAQTIRNDSAQAYYDEIVVVLRWLDEHPDQVPGRTISAGKVGQHAHLIRTIPIACQVETPTIIDFLEAIGITVVPDPEPTNKERLAQLIGGGIRANKQYADGLAEYLDDMGVTAPNVKDIPDD